MQEPKIFNIKKRSYIFSLSIISLLRKLPKDYITQTLCKQLVRCATSIGANIIEAYAASSSKDFANYYNIALKSANETKYWLMLLLHSNIAKKEDIDSLVNEVQEICCILAKSIVTVRGKK